MNELEKRAAYHRRRQRGLALTHLNTDAGNVEHNINMFNKMNSPVEGPSNNSISGPFGGDVSVSGECTAMGESLIYSDNDKMIDLEYDDIVVTVFGEKRDVDDWDEWEETIHWTYKVDKNDIEILIAETFLTEEDYPNKETATDEEFDQFIKEHFDELFEKYEEQIKEYYEYDAQEDAQARYEYQPPEPFIDRYEDDFWEIPTRAHKSNTLEEGIIDDDFDIFLRGV